MRVAEGPLPTRVLEHEAHAVVIEQLGRGERGETSAELCGECRRVAGVIDGKVRHGTPRELRYEAQPKARADRERAL